MLTHAGWDVPLFFDMVTFLAPPLPSPLPASFGGTMSMPPPLPGLISILGMHDVIVVFTLLLSCLL